MRYNYGISGGSFDTFQSFDILFDESLYTQLTNGIAPVDFDVLVLQPDLALASDGHYEAMALFTNPPLSGIFQVDFVYLGAGQPGSQPFLINQYDANGDLVSVLSQGTTVPFGEQVIPEPSTLSFVVGGMAAAALIRRRRRAG